ncbi:MAG TPA: hypothetical protein VNW98_00155 [Burkholderiaceae bacterium]|jgi:hypothetical protein|nr:hypothetical protein [Burkholderiaceae bacterium]
MNHINVETNVVEAQTSELQTLLAKQTEEAIAELNSSQLALVGGGCGAVILT